MTTCARPWPTWSTEERGGPHTLSLPRKRDAGSPALAWDVRLTADRRQDKSSVGAGENLSSRPRALRRALANARFGLRLPAAATRGRSGRKPRGSQRTLEAPAQKQ